ncbi:GNAT family N-acetyltransferase [Phenylobacterium sp.]|jgi:predicted acetyltransferase|uniref:GNAT family N-acetyltransferase n=1 Tax=Phenylobacterium sp. TaxID=1871053 RepID=UPI002E321C5D|nr:GNAT family N-acetyltransferase [Phenylobacterium sp.]HEX3363463.1 GNAT family N-acetyltransferase [Phenylobacterium sp.]
MPALVRPDLAYMASYVDALHEGYARDSLRPESPELIAQITREPEWFVRLVNNPPTTIVLPDASLGERVPETELWWVEDDRFLGSVGVRHRLNDLLEAWGGHIGYSVRPSARGQGHATAMLAAMLDHIREHLSLDRVTLTVNSNNPASMRVIEKNGGVFRDEIPHPWIEGDTGRRYWIDLR